MCESVGLLTGAWLFSERHTVLKATGGLAPCSSLLKKNVISHDGPALRIECGNVFILESAS